MTPIILTNIIGPIAGFAALIGLFLVSLRAVTALAPANDREDIAE